MAQCGPGGAGEQSDIQSDLSLRMRDDRCDLCGPGNMSQTPGGCLSGWLDGSIGPDASWCCSIDGILWGLRESLRRAEIQGK